MFDLGPLRGDAAPARCGAAPQGAQFVCRQFAQSRLLGRLRLARRSQFSVGQVGIPSKRNLWSIHGCRHDLPERCQRSHGSHSFSECFLARAVLARSGSTLESVGARFGAQPQGH